MSSEWQPIETAPRDTSRRVLLGWADRWVISGYWDNLTRGWRDASHARRDDPPPTHWQPLPDPPTEDE